ncbi:hypothetical protein DXA95_10030 [Odoribacter sp. OF09-27XD]|nr:hypothetical protein DXA95_10030 [Odoribacter sp. OF09-27XD]HBO27838.1 hypothetical protein [Culturomica sp.]
MTHSFRSISLLF